MDEVTNYPVVEQDNEDVENRVEDEEEQQHEVIDDGVGDQEMVDGGAAPGGGEVAVIDEDADEGFEGEAEDGEEAADPEGERFLNNNDLEDDEGGVEEGADGEEHLNETENGGGCAEGDGEVPPADSEEVAMMQLLLPDSESLYDPTLGFEPEANIKSPMNGFSSTYQDYFFPLIDSQSGVLFEIVQEVERAVYKSNEDLLRGVKEPVAIPASRLILKVGGPEIRLRIMDPSEPFVEGSSPSSSPTYGGNSSLALVSPQGWQKTKKSPESIQMEKQITPAEKAFSADKLAKLMVPFGHGWKREIVIRSHGGGASKKLGDVYYFSPQGIKYRSSKQVAIYLNKHPGLKMTVENFSFAKARVSYDSEQESVRAAQGGRNLNPVKNMLQQKQGGRTSSRGEHANNKGSIEDDENVSNGIGESSELPESTESLVKGRGGRRAIQPPKRYATAEFIPEPSKRAKMSQKSQEKESDNYSRGGGMEMGMLHPKYRPSEEEKTGEQMLQEFRARRGRPPTKGPLPGSTILPQRNSYQQQQQQQQNRGRARPREDGPMFGISALTQGASFSSFTEGLQQYGGHGLNSTQGSEGYDADTSLDMDEDGRVGGGSGDKAELLPCSIRCPGMTGEIPTLQCKRCLCLYHPGCLGLPNQPYRNFYCSNCEGDESNSAAGNSSGGGVGSPLQKQPSRNNVVLMKGGIRVMKRSEPPPLIHLNAAGGKFSQQGGIRRLLPKMPILQGGQGGGRPQQQQQQQLMGQGGGGGQMMMGRVPQPHGQGFQRLVPPALIRPGMQMSGGIRRGRGRPPRMSMNSGHPGQMNRGSVTITPISIQSPRGGGGGGGRGGQNQVPQIPRLQPMSGGSFMRRGMRKPGPGMMHQGGGQQMQQMGGQQQQQLMRSRGGGAPGQVRPQFVNQQQQHPQMQLLRRGGLAPRQRMPGPAVRLPGLRNSPIFRMDGEGRVTPRSSGLGMGQSPTTGGSPPQFQRYAQSVVTINQKKYLALPKNSSGVGAGTGAAATARSDGGGGGQLMIRSNNNSNSSSPSPTNAHSPENPMLAQRRAAEAAAQEVAIQAAATAGVSIEEVSTEEETETSAGEVLSQSEAIPAAAGVSVEEVSTEEEETAGESLSQSEETELKNTSLVLE